MELLNNVVREDGRVVINYDDIKNKFREINYVENLSIVNFWFVDQKGQRYYLISNSETSLDANEILGHIVFKALCIKTI